MPRRFFDSPSFSKSTAPSCWGEPMTNSSPASSQISRSSAPDLLADALRRPRPAGRRSAARRPAPCRAGRARAAARCRRRSDSSPRSPSCSRCQAARAPTRIGVGGGRVLGVGGQPALLGELAERDSRGGRARAGRRRASCRGRGSRGDDAERLGVVGDDRARRRAPRRRPRGARRSPVTTSSPAATAKRQPSSWASSSPSGTSGARTASATGRRPARARRRRRSVPSRTRAATRRLGHGGGRRGLGRPERLLQAPQRVAQLELAEDLAQARAVGLAADLVRARSTSTGTSRWIVASTFETRASSACSRQVLLALGAGDVVDVREDAPRGRRSAAAAATAVLSPMPGTPGMLSDVSPLSP